MLKGEMLMSNQKHALNIKQDNLQIRTAHIEDLPYLNELMRASKQHWGYDESFMNKYMLTFGLSEPYLNQGMIFAAFEENTLIGFYSFRYHPDSQLELDCFFIHPRVIQQGKGKVLWRSCVKKATEYGEKQFILWSDPNAVQFYFKMGCVKIGERQSPMMPGRYPAILQYSVV